MNNFEDMQSLWQQSHPKKGIDAGQMIQRIKQQQRREKSKLICGTVGLAATFFFILFIAFYYEFAFLSTRLGLALVLFSVVAAVLMNSNMIALLLRNGVAPDKDNQTMLANMERYQQKQAFFQTRFLSAYYLLLTIGLMLYMYEITRRNITFMIIVYAITLGWIAFAWWYIRPRVVRKQQERVAAMIDHIKELQSEMADVTK